MMKKIWILCLLLLIALLPMCIAEDTSLQIPITKTTKGTTSVTTTFFYAKNNLVASKGSTGTTYLHTDRLGSTRIATSPAGIKIGEMKTLPYGEEIRNTNNAKLTFTGKEEDTTNLYFFGARYYDSDLGRFTSVDPVKGGHEYAYTNDNPFFYTDPDGREEVIVTWTHALLGGGRPGAVSYIAGFQAWDGDRWTVWQEIPAWIDMNGDGEYTEGIDYNFITSGVPIQSGFDGTSYPSVFASMILDYPTESGLIIRVRVRGKSANGAIGLWSDVSNEYPYPPSAKSSTEVEHSDKETIEVFKEAIKYMRLTRALESITNFPNPVSGESFSLIGLTLGSETRLMIYDVRGRLVKENPTYEQIGEKSYKIFFGDLPSNTYFLRIQRPGEDPTSVQFNVVR